MVTTGSATPLIGIDAVVLDTETTGLDAGKARLLEVAVVRIAGGRIEPDSAWCRLVQPGEPIPSAATDIHGIDAAKLMDAPAFTELWPELGAQIGERIVIGHTVGFDIAVLKRECQLAGIAWQHPRLLDTRLLAQVAKRDLAGYSLDQIASWLGVEVTGRHSATGDAMTTAAVFQALVPKLRERGIRTVAEAITACRALTEVLDQQHRAGWVEAVEPARGDTERVLGRIDSYPYRHRIRDVMSAPAKFVPAETSIGAALQLMARERVSSLYVAAADTAHPPRPAETGIVTERDVLRALAEAGPAVLDAPVSGIMSQPLAALSGRDFVYRAIGRMSRLGTRHLGVTDEAGRVSGALSARDLLRLRAEDAVMLGDELDAAEDVHGLGRAWSKLPQVAAGLLREGVPGRDVAAVISSELGDLTRRAAVIAEQRLATAGRGAAPCAYAIAVLGSAGRGESLLAMDQDNALVFAEGAADGPEDRWFAELGVHLADILHEVGVPYCKGGVMAKNPAWRGSLATWRTRVGTWIDRSRPQDLLSVDIFFDLYGVHGDTRLADELWREAFAAARGKADFAKQLVEAAGSNEPGFGWLGGLKTSSGRIDLKKAGLFGIVSAARALAVCHHVVARSTPARIAGIKALGLGAERDLDAMLDAQALFLDLILAQQLVDMQHGRPPTNAVVVKSLAERDKDRLRAALRSIEHVDALVRDLLFNRR
jgi:DNA polymerase-3 subunit epsilon/CBS domain-containing protein